MTDLEITRLCAQAMGFRYELNSDKSEYRNAVCLYDNGSNLWNKTYNPLWNDEQAMAILKKFRSLTIPVIYKEWSHPASEMVGINSNRAICECVAIWQKTMNDGFKE